MVPSTANDLGQEPVLSNLAFHATPSLFFRDLIMESREPYRDDVELQSFQDGSDEPDFPLPLYSNPSHRLERPRWLINTNAKWWAKLSRRLREKIRPRFTWRYILCASILIYALYCVTRGSPLLASKLPSYTGKYGVGTVDLEIPVEQPRKISDVVFKHTGEPAFQLETILFSLYYPAKKGINSNKKHPWIPKPISLTAEGYTIVAHINNFISRPLFTFLLWVIAGGIDIPAGVDVPLLEKENNDGELFPLILLSHGTASSRTDYTQYCGELASRGAVVAAIEHRDGSGPGSLVVMADGKEKRVLFITEQQLGLESKITTETLKENQLAFRDAEIKETVRILRSIHQGNGSNIFNANTRKEGLHLENWKNQLDLGRIVVAGHSYGATGALQALKGAPSEDNPAIGGIIFDPGKSSGPLNHNISVPILVVQSESWSKKYSLFFGRPHFDTVRDLVTGVVDRIGVSWFLTSIGTSHPSVTDAPLIEPVILSWTTGATVNVYEGLKNYVKISVEFLEFLKTSKRTGILREPITHPEYGKDDRTQGRKKATPKEIADYWQIHVVPTKDDL